eukprot:30957-Pelagococcus_subviridis.AAC.50
MSASATDQVRQAEKTRVQFHRGPARQTTARRANGSARVLDKLARTKHSARERSRRATATRSDRAMAFGDEDERE